jgi:predicted DNA-binding transcriptional regulator AlpA
MNDRPERLLHERDAAVILGVSHYWLQRQRWLGTGPAWIKVGGPTGRAVRYQSSALEAWVAQNRVAGTHKSGHEQ